MPAVKHTYNFEKLDSKYFTNTVLLLRLDCASCIITTTLHPMMPDSAATLPPDVNHGAGLVTVAWVEAGLGLVFLLARIYTRVKIVKKMGLDDWTMIFATVSDRGCNWHINFETADHVRLIELDPGSHHFRCGYYASTLRCWQTYRLHSTAQTC